MRFAKSCLAIAALLIACPLRAAPASPVVPAAESIDGASQGTWSARWWQWASSFGYDESPVADTTGAHCGAGQSGKVWFLAGTYESTPIERSCELPAGRYLFVPLVNYVVMPSSCAGCLECEGAVAMAKRITDSPMGLVAELDGRALPELTSHRQATPECFDVAARAAGAPKVFPSASNGYWLMIEPLPKGKHTLRIGGSLPSIRQDVTYKLIVR